MTPVEVLKKYWGYTHFREPQEQIIKSVLEGRDVLAILPTGGGKSLCYQVPALMNDGICLVISPLIALMQDQVKQLRSFGVPAIAIHSGLSNREIDILLDNCIYGKEKFLYLSPERLQTEIFKERVKKMKVNLIAVDEAHCISQWGHDFRPSYLLINTLREYHPDVPWMALTASATKPVKQEIVEKLELENPVSFQISFARENLFLVVRNVEEKEKKVFEILAKVPGPSIVYTRSRKTAVSFCKRLETEKISATYYHGGLKHQQRSEHQDLWISNKVRVIVATNAFGMGINKPDVRSVIHIDLPEDIESYYQEAGRAGRDGRRAYATIVYHKSDVHTLERKVEQAHPDLEYLKRVYQALANYFQLAEGSAMDESFNFDLDDFARKFDFQPSSIYPALKKLEEEGLIQFNEGFYRPSRLHFCIDKKKIYEFQVAHAHFDPVIKMALRLYGAELFSDFVEISESQLASALKNSRAEVAIILEQLHKLQVVVYEQQSDMPQITWTLPRQDANRLPIDVGHMNKRRENHFNKMKSLIGYVEQDIRCRMQVIQDYFGEETFEVCGRCDVCISKRKSKDSKLSADYREQIAFLLRQKPLTIEELEQSVSPSENELFIEIVREMVEEGLIYYDELWTLHFS